MAEGINWSVGALKLLVSVRGAEEAVSAWRGGAHIIDVKNPAEGSLGANQPWVIARVREVIPNSIEMSATIGDLPCLPGTASLAALAAARCGAHYVKAGILDGDPSNVKRILSCIRKALDWGAPGSKLIACGYGDFEKIGTLDVCELTRVASNCGCDGILIDLQQKRGESVLDVLGTERLFDVSRICHASGMILGIAGGLGEDHVEVVRSLGADVFGVRASVCRSGDRLRGCVDEDLVRQLSHRVMAGEREAP